jgi:hypothetical protein
MQSLLDPIITEASMPLNQTDKAWITLEIQNALRRKGWGRLTGFLKDWSGAGAAIAILVLFFTQWTAYVEFRTKTGDRLDAIEKVLPQISASLELLKPHASNTLPRIMKDAIQDKAARKIGLQTVAALATQAQEQKVAADPLQIADVGKTLTSMPALFKQQNNADAWSALTGLLNYSSFLKAASYFSGEQPQPLTFAPIEYDIGGTAGKSFDVTLYSLGGMVPIAEAARAEHIVNPKPIAASMAPKIVVVKGKPEQVISLDGHRLKNIVILNMTIEYRGGPAILENVSFVNCIFRLAQQPQCVDFGKSVFASTTTTFASSS